MDVITKLYEQFLQSEGVEIDSRKLKPGQMFFAFKGEHTDGHKFVKNALDIPGCTAVVDNPEYADHQRAILVPNTLEALQMLARKYRASFDVPVFALTGSNGKTTTKELIMSALQTGYKIHATVGNYNNHIGVPLTLLAAPKDSEILIIEMGANRLKDIEELCEIADPDMGLITNIGTAHIGTFGSQENILAGKTELYDYIAKKGGILFVNSRDTVLLSEIPGNTELVLYPDGRVDISEEDMYLSLMSKSTGKVYLTQLSGSYNAENIHAALSIAAFFDVDLSDALEAISKYQPRMNRSEIRDIGDIRLIMDAYNANPTSMKASLESLDRYPAERQKILVLGDMLELGEKEVEYHREILELLKAKRYEKVILVGQLFRSADKEGTFEHHERIEDVLESYREQQDEFKHALIFLKASRSIKLEKFLELFKEN